MESGLSMSFPGAQKLFWSLLSIDLLIQWLMFIPSYLLQTEKFYDLTGSVTVIALAFINHSWTSRGHPRQELQSFAIVLWAFRLGAYLFTRILKDGQDRRFKKIKPNPLRFFVAWTLQGVWVFVTLLPSLISMQNKQTPLGMRDFIGWTMWLIGFAFETIADYQKSVFRNNPANKDKFICTGLWSISRHPNYFGEILLWFGMYVSASSTFSARQCISVFCPVFNYLLIMKLSGAPMLQSYGLKKWGHLASYKSYISRTPELVPYIGE